MVSNEQIDEEEWVDAECTSDAEVRTSRRSLDDVYAAVEEQSRRLEEAIALFTSSNTRSATTNGSSNEPQVPLPEIAINKLLSTLQSALSLFHDKHSSNPSALSSAYTTLLMYMNKIREFPTTSRYQRISPSSSSFKQLATLEGYEAVIAALGFRMVETTPNKHSLPSGANRVYEWQWSTLLEKSDIAAVLEQTTVLIHNMRSALPGTDEVPSPIPVSGFIILMLIRSFFIDVKPITELPEPPQAFKFDEVSYMLMYSINICRLGK